MSEEKKKTLSIYLTTNESSENERLKMEQVALLIEEFGRDGSKIVLSGSPNGLKLDKIDEHEEAALTEESTAAFSENELEQRAEQEELSELTEVEQAQHVEEKKKTLRQKTKKWFAGAAGKSVDIWVKTGAKDAFEWLSSLL